MRLDKLRRRVLAAKQEFAWERGDYDADPSQAPPEVITRWMVNAIRHEHSNYETLVRKCPLTVNREAYETLKARVNARIRELYPTLRANDEAGVGR